MEYIAVKSYAEDSITEAAEFSVLSGIVSLGFLLQEADNLVNGEQDKKDEEQQCDFHKHHSLSSYNLLVQLMHFLTRYSDGASCQGICQVFSPEITIVQGQLIREGKLRKGIQ